MLGIVLVSSTAWGMRTRRPPTLTDLTDKNQLVELNNYLSEVFELTNGRYTLENLDINPQDVRKGVKGDLVYATYSSIDHLCINTSFPAGKDWTCVNVETLSTCPGGDNKYVQYNRNGTCMGDLAFIFNEDNNSVGIGEDVLSPVATLEIDPADTTVSGEVVAFRSSAQTLTFASSGSTVASQRQNQFYAPTINGIAGGATETVTSSSTVYVDGPPSGSNVTFTNGPWSQWLDCTTDGDCLNLLVSNSQTNDGNLNETAQIRFGFGTDLDVARMIVGKIGGYTGAATNSDSFIAFNVDADNVSREVMRIAGTINSPAPAILGVAIGATDTSLASLYIEPFGNAATSLGLLVRDFPGTLDMLQTVGDNSVVVGDVDHTGSVGITVYSGGRASIALQGTQSFNSPAGVQLTTSTSPTFTSEIAIVDVASPTFQRYASWDNSNLSGIQTESPFVLFNPTTVQSIGIATGATLTNQRAFIFNAQTINGVVGGATETVTNAATVYIDAAPSGSDITFTNGPYAIWSDSGKNQLDGPLQLGQNGASGQLVIYAELGGTDYTTTFNPSASQTQNVTYTMPPNDGTASGILVTDGSGVLSWGIESYATQWTPTANSIANLDASASGEGQFLRLGPSVSFSVRITVDPTAPATSTQLELDLPIASDFGSTDDASGTCFAPGIAGQGAAILADTASDELEIRFISGDVTSQAMYCSGVYQVL